LWHPGAVFREVASPLPHSAYAYAGPCIISTPTLPPPSSSRPAPRQEHPPAKPTTPTPSSEGPLGGPSNYCCLWNPSLFNPRSSNNITAPALSTQRPTSPDQNPCSGTSTEIHLTPIRVHYRLPAQSTEGCLLHAENRVLRLEQQFHALALLGFLGAAARKHPPPNSTTTAPHHIRDRRMGDFRPNSAA